MDVSIVIVSWNARDYLVKCLRSIEETRGYLALEAIVVDNASSDGSPEAVVEQFPWVQLIQTGANLGFARANNVGIARSTGRYVCLINSDVVVLKGCIQGLVEFMDVHPTVGLAGPRILNADRTLQISMRRSPSLWANWGQALFLDRAPLLSTLFPRVEIEPSMDDGVREAQVLYGMFWMVSRRALEQVGGLDEDYFMYGEDVDWCLRFHAAKWQVMYYPSSEAIHFGAASSAVAPTKYFIENRKSRLLYFQKNHGRWARTVDAGALFVESALRTAVWSMACWLGRGDARRNTLMRNRNAACLKWLVAASATVDAKDYRAQQGAKEITMTKITTLRTVVRNLITQDQYSTLRRLYRRLNAWLYRGERFHCPVCGGLFRDFKSFGADVAVARDLRMVSLGRRVASMCPGCASKERDRAIALYLTQRSGWFRQDPRAILHIAPEEGLGLFLRMLPNVSYLSGDLCPKDSPTPAMRRIDVTQMPFEGGTFDLIVCSHVMEHVADDRQAMREALRVLKEGGVAFLQVPYSPALKETREDVAVTEAADRLRLYGQEDHVRLYGTDYAERLREVGFTVTVRGMVDLFGEEIARKNGLALEENLFVCSKGPSALSQTDGAKL